MVLLTCKYQCHEKALRKPTIHLQGGGKADTCVTLYTKKNFICIKELNKEKEKKCTRGRQGGYFYTLRVGRALSMAYPKRSSKGKA